MQESSAKKAPDFCVSGCSAQACNIQACLARFVYDSAKCKDEVAAWQTCCDRLKQRRAGGDAPALPASPPPSSS